MRWWNIFFFLLQLYYRMNESIELNRKSIATQIGRMQLKTTYIVLHSTAVQYTNQLNDSCNLFIRTFVNALESTRLLLLRDAANNDIMI
jgi:hypothetical protein